MLVFQGSFDSHSVGNFCTSLNVFNTYWHEWLFTPLTLDWKVLQLGYLVSITSTYSNTPNNNISLHEVQNKEVICFLLVRVSLESSYLMQVQLRPDSPCSLCSTSVSAARYPIWDGRDTSYPVILFLNVPGTYLCACLIMLHAFNSFPSLLGSHFVSPALLVLLFAFHYFLH